ncbi:branched-chain amino acid ABC transporter substrate-binding protein, partial [Frankia sp. Cpl3]|nr:branched-chain amino acid ABC transporter substrate-binding protein [Frankia sp. Cpl3]
MIIRRTLAAIAAAGLLSAALVACGDDGDSDSTTSAAGLTGAPITIQVFTSLNSVTPHTESYEGAQAAAAAVNASG